MGRKPIDETGNKYGKWTVLRKAEEKNSCGQVCWICQCECGTIKSISGKILRRGKSKSCGCGFKTVNIGDRFEKLTVLKMEYVKEGHKYYRCLCDCGKQAIVRGSDLTSKNTKSCGCLGVFHERHKLLNKKFGYLTVVKDMGNDEAGNSLWLCKCQCGNEKIVRGGNLANNQTLSCGCKKSSKGEIKIKNILEENHIKYKKEYQPPNLKQRFDFAILNNEKIDRLIEFDGIQHFENWYFDKNNDDFLKRQINDDIKNKWAKENNIPLVRIPYWEFNNITLDFLLSDKFVI